MPRQHIEFIARGILVQNNQVLVCQNKKHSHIFLPGGHVDFGESARYALAREILEETGLRVRVGQFLGVCEAQFLQNERQHHEINLIFKLSTRQPIRHISSREKNLRFLLIPIRQVLARDQPVKLLPPGIASFLHLADKPTRKTTGRGGVPTFVIFCAAPKPQRR